LYSRAATLVAVALDADLGIALVAEVARVRLHQAAVLVLDGVGVVVEEHAALGQDVAGVDQRGCPRSPDAAFAGIVVAAPLLACGCDTLEPLRYRGVGLGLLAGAAREGRRRRGS
jgi:hypothetical protein